MREPKELTDNGYIADSVNVPIRDLFKSMDKLKEKDAVTSQTETWPLRKGRVVVLAYRRVKLCAKQVLGLSFSGWCLALAIAPCNGIIWRDVASTGDHFEYERYRDIAGIVQ